MYLDAILAKKQEADELNRKSEKLQECLDLYSECLREFQVIWDASSIKAKQETLRAIFRALLSNRCSVLLRLKKPELALEDAEKLKRNDPEWFRTHQRLGECHKAMDNLYYALPCFDEAYALAVSQGDGTAAESMKKERNMIAGQMRSKKSSPAFTDSNVFGEIETLSVIDDPGRDLPMGGFENDSQRLPGCLTLTPDKKLNFKARDKAGRVSVDIQVRKILQSGVYVLTNDSRQGSLPSFLFERPESFTPVMIDDLPASPWGLGENNSRKLNALQFLSCNHLMLYGKPPPKAAIGGTCTLPISFDQSIPFNYWGEEEISRRYIIHCAGIFTYFSLEVPEVQWLKKRAEHKMREIISLRLKPQRQPLLHKLLTFEIKAEWGPVTRTFTVPAHTLLSVFAEKVLIPILGFSRSYHTYVFETKYKADGSLYGPQLNQDMTSGTDPHREYQVDANFSFMHGWGVFMNAAAIRIADIMPDQLTEEGSSLSAWNPESAPLVEFVYDLGERFTFQLVLKKIEEIPALESGRRLIQCTDGAYAGLSEDRNGMVHFTVVHCSWMGMGGAAAKMDALSKHVDSTLCYLSSLSVPMTAEKRAQLENTTNYHHILGDLTEYDFKHFSKDATNRYLFEALSTRNGSGGHGHGCACCKASFFLKVYDYDVNEVCAYCGRGQGFSVFENGHLQLCGKCSTIKYCSAVCQKLAWKEHKLECARRKAISDETELDITGAMLRLERRMIAEGLIDRSVYNDGRRETLQNKDDAYKLTKLHNKQIGRVLSYCTDKKMKKLIANFYETTMFRRAAANKILDDPNAEISFDDLQKAFEQVRFRM